MIYLEKSPARGVNRRIGTGLLQVVGAKRGLSGDVTAVATLAKMPNHNLVMDQDGFAAFVKRVAPCLFVYDDEGNEVSDKATRTRRAVALLRSIADALEVPEGEG